MNLLLAASIKIIFIGASKPSRRHLRKFLTVRRQRILDALNWLKINNTLYSHISLNKHIITALPDKRYSRMSLGNTDRSH